MSRVAAKPQTADRLITTNDVAEIYLVTDETIRAWAKAGLLPGVVMLGTGRKRTYRFRRSAILEHAGLAEEGGAQ